MADEKRQKCIARTEAGHNCTKPAKEGHRLCWLHLRKQKPPQPKASNPEIAKLIKQFDAEDFDGIDPTVGMNMLAAVWLGLLTEWKTTGGDGELKEVPMSGKDRIAAVNTWLMRYSQVYGDGQSNAEAALEAFAKALPGFRSDE